LSLKDYQWTQLYIFSQTFGTFKDFQTYAGHWKKNKQMKDIEMKKIKVNYHIRLCTVRREKTQVKKKWNN
jgi:hypothetical protein